MAKLNSTYENSWQRVSDSLTRVEALMKQLYFLKFGEEWDEVQAAELKSRSDVERDTQDEDLRLGSVISLTSKSEEDEQEEINIGAVILEPEAEVTEASVDLRSEHLNDEQFGSYEVSDVHVSPCDMEVNDRRYSKVFNAGTTNLEMGTECVEDEVIIDCSNVEATQADDEQEEVKTVAMIQSNANWKILLESVGSTDVNVLAVPIEIDAKFGCVYDAHEVLDEWYDRDTITNSTKVTEMDWGNKKIKIMGESFGFEEIWFLVGALTCEINAATVSTCSKTKIYGSPNLLSTAPKTYKHEDSSLAWMALSVLDVFILDKEKENFSIARFKSFPFDPGGCWYSNLYWTDVSYTELNLEDKVVFEDWGEEATSLGPGAPVGGAGGLSNDGDGAGAGGAFTGGVVGTGAGGELTGTGAGGELTGAGTGGDDAGDLVTGAGAAAFDGDKAGDGALGDEAGGADLGEATGAPDLGFDGASVGDAVGVVTAGVAGDLDGAAAGD
ncbi:glycine-rich cell wall structural protein-like [Senna tora]|uniref:Glycine-rich cell wall structural protein-like n=1 Tax=Senna tora TaxID=362788 RepID=A0A834SUA7_9FABA|nr:glycine-rich cell wall structural protein-like [Senna tora]